MKKHRPIDLPAGDERREAMAKSKDALEEQAEVRSADTMALPPFKPDHEILSHLNETEVSNPHPNYVYCWCFETKTNNLQVRQKLSLSIRTPTGIMPCWEVVHGDMQEARECKDVEGKRRCGDVILLRCRKDVYLVLQEHEEEKRRRQQEGTTSELQAFARENRKGLILHDNPDDPRFKQIFGDEMARHRVDRRLREGTMPGAEMRR